MQKSLALESYKIYAIDLNLINIPKMAKKALLI